jgi:PTS system mannose-specific IIC component
VIKELTLIGLGAIGLALALIYITLSKMGSSNDGGGGDPLGDILNDY